jgi:transposase
MKQEDKNKRKNTKDKTKERRSILSCRTYCLKLDKSKLNKKSKLVLNRLFLETKWFYNFLLTQDFETFDTKIETVTILNKDKQPEQRDLKFLSSQMKQAIFTRTINNCSGLKETKKKGRKIGKLKFKSQVNSIPLKQFRDLTKENSSGTFWFVNEKLKIQNIKQKLKVNGFKQLNNFLEISNAVLIKLGNDYFINVTGYENPKEFNPSCDLGVDFGIKDNLTFSNGIQVNINIPESKQTKKIQRRISKSKKGSKNRFKLRLQLQKSYLKTTNKKKDVSNKINSYLKQNCKISMQDEMISNWHKGLFGKQVQHSSMGEIKSLFKQNKHTFIVSKSFPSTQLCPICGCLTKLDLNQRIFKCEHCGFEEHRDLKSSKTILAERKEVKPMENLTSVEMFEYLNSIPNISVSWI